jgi:hypothetical protein
MFIRLCLRGPDGHCLGLFCIYNCFHYKKRAILRRYNIKHIFTCRSYAWRIITLSGLDDWIYWYLPLQSLLITINLTAHNRWLPNTRSIPYWTTSVFSSTVTLFRLTSRSLLQLLLSAVNIPQLNSLLRMIWTTTDLRIFYTSVRTEERPPPRTVRLLLLVSSVATKRVLSRGNALISTSMFIATKRVFSEPLSSNGLFRHNINIGL